MKSHLKTSENCIFYISVIINDFTNNNIIFQKSILYRAKQLIEFKNNQYLFLIFHKHL